MNVKKETQVSKARQSRQMKSVEKRPFYKLDSHQITGVLLFFAFSFLVILTCFVGQFPPGLQVLPNQIAKIRIVAEFPFSYVSKILTNRRNDTLRHQIAPVYTIDDKPLDQFKKHLGKLELELDKMQELVGKLTKEEELVLLEPISKTYDEDTDSYVSPEDLLQILTKTTIAKRKEIFREGLVILEDMMHEGIYGPIEVDGEEANDNPYFFSMQIDGRKKDGSVQSEKEALRYLSLNLSALDIEWGLSRAFFRVLKAGARPNLLYNAEKSEKKIQDALAALDPIVVNVKAGETIIEPGSLIGPEQMEQLRSYHEFLNETEDAGFGYNVTLKERAAITLVILLTALLYIKVSIPKVLRSNRRIALSALVMVFNLGIIRLVFELGDTHLLGSNAIAIAVLPFLAPVCLAPMAMSIMSGPRLAILIAILVSTFYALMLGFITDFLLIGLLASLVAIYFSKEIRLRNEAIRAGTLSGLTVAATALFLGVFSQSTWQTSLFQVLFALMTGTLTGFLVIGMLPYLENLFEFTTNITFLELSDYNHPLLRRLQMEAPGTYHHSLMVANLAERAAGEIEANGLICRVGALFHDVGKLVKPEYFVENQKEGINPHLEKNPSMSALVIKSHVKEGIVLAVQHRLPRLVIDVIEQHHGTTLIKYFYEKAIRRDKQRQLPFENIGVQDNSEDMPVEESTFRYDGPKPQFKESAIIGLADSIEAASRSLKKATSVSIEQLVDNIVREKLEDQQLDECPLTFKELQKLKKSFVMTLLNMLHSRIDYQGKEQTKREAIVATNPDEEAYDIS